jgi:hypothetical protein
MSFVKKHWFGIALGAVAVVGGSCVAAHAASGSTQQVSLTQAQVQASAAPKARAGLGVRRLVHGDLLVQGKGGELRNVRVDHGVLQSVDGSTLVLKEGDGSTVDIATTDQTKFVRDRQPAKITDLKAGDQVWTLRLKNADGSFTTLRVRARSAAS